MNAKVRVWGQGQPAGPSAVDHSPLTVRIDVRGVIRYRYLGGFPQAGIVAADVRSVLKGRTAR